MSDTTGHTPEPCQATPADELERQILDSREPKNEREWWASREIAALRAEPRCSEEERELLDRLYKDHSELKDDMDFDGWYCDWQEIIDICASAGVEGYCESPAEMIRQIINERDAAIAALRTLGEAAKTIADDSQVIDERFFFGVNVNKAKWERFLSALSDPAVQRAMGGGA